MYDANQRVVVPLLLYETDEMTFTHARLKLKAETGFPVHVGFSLYSAGHTGAGHLMPRREPHARARSMDQLWTVGTRRTYSQQQHRFSCDCRLGIYVKMSQLPYNRLLLSSFLLLLAFNCVSAWLVLSHVLVSSRHCVSARSTCRKG